MPSSPDHPVILAGTPPGGGQDRVARAIVEAYRAETGVVILVENLAGRGGGNAWDELARRRGDSVAAVSSPTLVTNRLLGVSDLGYSDLAHVAVVCSEDIVFAVPAGRGPTEPESLALRIAAGNLVVALATARGNVNHVAVAMVARHAGGEGCRVPIRVFDSALHAIADVLEGGSDVVAVSAASLVPEVSTGRLVPVATSGTRRARGSLAAAPTWLEQGVPCVIGTWRGVVTAQSREEVPVWRWSEIMEVVLASSSWADAVELNSWTELRLLRSEAADFVARQDAVMKEALAEMGLLDG